MTSAANIAIGVFSAGLLLYGVNSCARYNAQREEDVASLDRYDDDRKPPFSGWKYTTKTDGMRGTKTERADLLAENYDVSRTPTLSVWQKSDGARGAMISGALSEFGQIQCSPSTGSIAVKADDGPVQNLKCQMGMSVAVEPKLFDIVKKSKTLIVEVGDGYNGVSQFTFKTGGLNL